MLKKIIYILAPAIMFAQAFTHAKSADTHRPELPIQHLVAEIEGFYLFEGDRHGDFKGDLVVVLSDGSAWKGHPENISKLNYWEAGDVVHIEARTSFYWFKREHKFLLYNHDRNESVKAMLIDYGESPLEITFTTKAYPTSTELVPVHGIDMDDNPKITGHEIEPCNYKKRILISDGSTFEINKNLYHFKVGVNVYFGFNGSEKPEFFIITGNEREAKWSRVEKVSAK